MKRIIALCVISCMAAVAAFAQINVGGYTKSFWIPYRVTVFEDGEAKQTTAVQVPWGEPDISAGINVDGWSEWGGIHLGLDIANGAGNRSAHALSAKGSGWVWAKPFGFINVLGMDSFTIWLGSPNNSTLEGKIGGSDFATYVLNKSYNMNNILANNGQSPQNSSQQRDFRLEIQDPQFNTFTRFNPYSWGNANENDQNIWWPRTPSAAMITWEPIEHLFIGFFVAPEMLDLRGWNADTEGVMRPDTDSINGKQLSDDDINQDFYDVKKVYRKMQVGAGYTIPGIGQVRAQFIGVRNVVELAFQLTAVRDWMFDFGFKLPFEGTDKEDTLTYKKKRDYGASVAATFRYYDFRLMGHVDAAFAGSDSSAREVKVRGLNLIAYIVPSYQLGDIGSVGLDLGFEYEQADDFNAWEADSMQAGAALWFRRDMGNATFKTGPVFRLPFEWAGNKQPFDFMFPIMLSVGF